MAKRIFKYPIEIKREQLIKIPRYCTPLTIQMQNEIPVIWCMVDMEQNPTDALIRIFGTGEEIPDGFHIGSEHNLYLGTVQKGEYVWHVFIAGVFTTIN